MSDPDGVIARNHSVFWDVVTVSVIEDEDAIRMSDEGDDTSDPIVGHLSTKGSRPHDGRGTTYFEVHVVLYRLCPWIEGHWATRPEVVSARDALVVRQCPLDLVAKLRRELAPIA